MPPLYIARKRIRIEQAGSLAPQGMNDLFWSLILLHKHKCLRYLFKGEVLDTEMREHGIKRGKK